ncbi:MAG: GtrA family protein [Pseudomonadota bacterium]
MPLNDFKTLARQLGSFSWIGVVGFLVDAGTFLVLFGFVENLYGARAGSYLAAASATWFLNRRFTFAASEHSMLEEWGRFIALQTGGGAVNYGLYAALVASIAFFASNPVIAIAAGSLAGMGVNFLTAKLFVFESRKRGS